MVNINDKGHEEIENMDDFQTDEILHEKIIPVLSPLVDEFGVEVVANAITRSLILLSSMDNEDASDAKDYYTNLVLHHREAFDEYHDEFTEAKMSARPFLLIVRFLEDKENKMYYFADEEERKEFIKEIEEDVESGEISYSTAHAINDRVYGDEEED